MLESSNSSKGIGLSRCGPLDLRVLRIDPHADSRWQPFVAETPGATIYHHPAWIKAVEEEFGQRSCHLACQDSNGELVGVLPLLYTKGLPFGLGGSLTGQRLSSLPRTPVAGPLARDRNVAAALLNEAVSLARQTPGCQLQIKTAGPELEGLVPEVIPNPWRMNYVLELPDRVDGPYRVPDSRERSKIKWSINKAAKAGLRVRPAVSELDLRNWYALYLETMRRVTIPPRPYRFFAALWKFLMPAGMIELLLAEYVQTGRQTAVAGSLFLKFGSTVWYAFSGTGERSGSLRSYAGDAIQWQAINDACKRGFRRFDFGEVPEGHTTLADFKLKWGARPERLYRYYSPAVRAEAIEQHGGNPSLSRAVWRRLPLPVTAWLGSRIYSYL